MYNCVLCGYFYILVNKDVYYLQYKQFHFTDIMLFWSG